MNMDRRILYKKICKKIFKHLNNIANVERRNFDWNLIDYLLKKIIFNDPTKNCVIKGDRLDWVGLPKDKSLFYCKPWAGLPIGNLTSQLFGNVYLMDFDLFIKYELGFKRYGRYVDDFVVVSRSKQLLKNLPALADKYLSKNLGLKIHPKKIHLQHFSRGSDFLGGYIKPGRIYVRNRTKGSFYKTIDYFKKLSISKKGFMTKEDCEKFEASIGSYLGNLKNYNSINLRKKMMRNIGGYWENYFYYSKRKGRLCRKRK